VNMVCGGEIAKGAPDSLQVAAGEKMFDMRIHFIREAMGDVSTNFGSHQVGSYFSRKLGHLLAKNLRIDISCVSRFP
jgi:hypothetical protein